MSTSAIRRSRSVPGSSWALGRTLSDVLAGHWQVKPATARKRRTEGRNCVNETNALIRDPKVNGAAIVISHMESLVAAYIEEIKKSPTEFRAKYDRWVNQEEHFAQARQDRALMTGENVNNALLEHAEVLVKIYAGRRALGLEDDDR